LAADRHLLDPPGIEIGPEFAVVDGFDLLELMPSVADQGKRDEGKKEVDEVEANVLVHLGSDSDIAGPARHARPIGRPVQNVLQPEASMNR
jgi:hypothetical protein